MAIMQNHHITYEPEWDVPLGMAMHRVISRVQTTKATMEQYVKLTNYLHAITFEWNRMRSELDIGLDLRIKKPKKQVKIEKMKRTK